MFAALALRARKHLPVPVSVSALKLNQRALKLKRIECRDGKEGGEERMGEETETLSTMATCYTRQTRLE